MICLSITEDLYIVGLSYSNSFYILISYYLSLYIHYTFIFLYLITSQDKPWHLNRSALVWARSRDHQHSTRPSTDPMPAPPVHRDCRAAREAPRWPRCRPTSPVGAKMAARRRTQSQPETAAFLNRGYLSNQTR